MDAPDLLAALPMYDYPELNAAHDALWSAIAIRLRAHGIAAPQRLTRGRKQLSIWSDPSLLIGQGCEYPLAKCIPGSFRHVATPCYTAPGCAGDRYRSAILVRRADSANTLAELRMRRCVINDPDSNSGMNLLRAAIAPLAAHGGFFHSVTCSGSHRNSAAMVGAGEADVAALDCVSYAHLQRLYPADSAGLRVLAWTDATPSLPWITARGTSDATLAVLRSILEQVIAEESLRPVREQLLLAGFVCKDTAGYAQVLDLERRAAAQGYPDLV